MHELKDVVAQHRPGEQLRPPPSLPHMTIGGLRLAYADVGAIPSDAPFTSTVVLLHGFGGFFMDWPRVMAPLARHTRVLTIDLPGWGFSEPNLHARSLEEQVHLLNQFLTKLDLQNVVLCGLSYGAGVAWAAAAMHLHRVREVVLLNPMPTYPLRFLRSPLYRGIFLLSSLAVAGRVAHRFLTKYQYKLICRENLLNDRLLDSFYLDLAYLVIKQPTMPQILAAHAVGARNLDWGAWEHRLASVRMPVSILQGLQDRIFSLESARHLHRLIPTSELHEIEACGHAMVFDQHRKVSDFLLKKINHKRDSHEFVQKTVRPSGS